VTPSGDVSADSAAERDTADRGAGSQPSGWTGTGEDTLRKYAGNPWLVLLVVSLGFFMTLLDKTFLRAQTSESALAQLMTCESPKEES
jgi:hypothetical protein